MINRPYSPSDDESIITLLRLNKPEYFVLKDKKHKFDITF
jgi:hypothetical protein